MKTALPFSLTLICGAIGKEFVIKHYKDGAVKTKYPDMSEIVPSVQQRRCRNLFREAVAYAKTVISDSDGKACWQKKLRKTNGVYNAAIKEYMLREKKLKQKELIATNRLLKNALMIIMEEKNIITKDFMGIENIGPARISYNFSISGAELPEIIKTQVTASNHQNPCDICIQYMKINPG